MGDYLQKEYEEVAGCDINKHARVENPKVSVIIPVYNVKEYIRQALNSVVNQTLEEIEIICVNDCTPDNSFEIVKEYAKNDERFVLLELESNQGQGIARNRAIDIAKGDYIMFLDPDDWFELDACEKAYNQISKNQNDMVFFNLEIQKEKNGKFHKKELNVERLGFFRKIAIKSNKHINLAEIEDIWITACWTVVQIYSREFLNANQIRYSNNRFLEDLAFFAKAVVCAKDISILDEPLYIYRQELAKRNTDYSRHYKDVLSTKTEAYEIIKESGNTNILNNFIIYQINSDLYWLKVFSRQNKKIRKEFFDSVKEKCQKLSKEYSKELLKKSCIYSDFELILRCKNYEEYKIKRVLRKIFKQKSWRRNAR